MKAKTGKATAINIGIGEKDREKIAKGISAQLAGGIIN